MFTGLVEATARVLEVKEIGLGLKEMVVEKPDHFDDLENGHSVAHNGVCLTIKNKNPQEDQTLSYDLGKETLSVTTFKDLKEGAILNLERPLKVGERLHGHLVSGHVDEVASVAQVQEVDGGCLVITIKGLKAPEYIWAKGSIVINGVSLTINEADLSQLSVCLIPETLAKTNLSLLQPGDLVNIEYDFWAKGVIHAERLKERGFA